METLCIRKKIKAHFKFTECPLHCGSHTHPSYKTLSIFREDSLFLCFVLCVFGMDVFSSSISSVWYRARNILGVPSVFTKCVAYVNPILSLKRQF